MGFPSRLSALDPVLGPGRQCRLPVRGLCRARCRHRHAANQPHRRVLAEPGGHQPVDLRAARCLEERAPWAGHNQVFRPVTEGAQHVRDKGAAIIASNHLSFADWFFIPLALDRRITFVAKSDHFARGLSGAPVIPSAIIGIDIIAPPGKIITKIVSPTMEFGEPLDFSRYEGMSEDRFILRTITDVIMYAIMELSGQEYVDIYAPAAKEAAAAKLRQGRPTRCLLRPERYLDASRAGRPQADDDCAIRGSKGVGEGYSQRRERNRRNQGLRPWTASWCWPWGVCGRHRPAPTAGLASLAVLPAECQFERQPDCRRSVPRRRVARGSGRCAVVMASELANCCEWPMDGADCRNGRRLGIVRCRRRPSGSLSPQSASRTTRTEPGRIRHRVSHLRRTARHWWVCLVQAHDRLCPGQLPRAGSTVKTAVIARREAPSLHGPVP
jgi:hypothetical protein